MATLTVKNLPDPLYAKLKARAAENRRSINSEAILAVERALAEHVATDPARLLATLRRARHQLKGIHLTDSDLHAARDHGRA